MIKAFKKDEELLSDIRSTDPRSIDVRLWWLGQSGYLIQYKGKRILLDPYLSDSLTVKYQHTEKPHVRISERVIDPSLLPKIDIITSSHNHTDHLDAETINPILNNSPYCKLIIPEANRKFVADRLKINADFPIGLNAGESFTEDDISFYAIPAAHNELDVNEDGKYPYLGYIIQLGSFAIYHSGDTLNYKGIEEWISPFKPAIALLPINGNDPERKVAGNLNAEEAVALGKKCHIPVVIPCHYDLFAFNTADVNQFISIAKRSSQGYCVLELGGKFSSYEI
ncbi:MAG: MBL fold metallo-hydrolase [Bacteroidota bacterium]|jgi:L-ascorbate metabolism protein UlaG (beta-lactamase superfamily)